MATKEIILIQYILKQVQLGKFNNLRTFIVQAELDDPPRQDDELFDYLNWHTQKPEFQPKMINALKHLEPQLFKGEEVEETVSPVEKEVLRPQQHAPAPTPPATSEFDEEPAAPQAEEAAPAPAPTASEFDEADDAGKKKKGKFPILWVAIAVFLCLSAFGVLLLTSDSSEQESPMATQAVEDDPMAAAADRQATQISEQQFPTAATQPTAAPADNGCNVTCTYPGWTAAGEVGLYDYCAEVTQMNNREYREEYLRVAQNCGTEQCPEDAYRADPYAVTILELTLSCGE